MLALCREQRLEHRTKHIALCYFLARELQQRGQLRLAYVASEANTADVFTKALAPCDHQRCCTQLGLLCFALLDWSCDPLFSPTLPMEDMDLHEERHNLAADRDLTGGFCGNRAFATPADEADWDEQNVDGASEEAGPLPFCSMPISMDDDNPRESVNTEVYYDFTDNGYVTPQPVDTNISERIGPNILPDPEAGDEAAYPEDANLPRYTQSGLQILGLVTAVHGAAPPKEPATLQQALGGGTQGKMAQSHGQRIKGIARTQHLEIRAYRSGTQQDHHCWENGKMTGKWVFRVKTKAVGTIDKFKARWVMRGFDQEHGRDFTETFALVSRHTSLQILFVIASMERKKLRQIDVANDEQPHGFNADPNQIC
ncbi:unnamed protein product [Closterium sp. NIES-53]